MNEGLLRHTCKEKIMKIRAFAAFYSNERHISPTRTFKHMYNAKLTKVL